ncbi:peptidase M48 [Actibacterium pelagium]|uniref:Peptidase M48 n=2 Tax=Actibacterium pelagium TaxID=2029103 RepID=A0A917ADN3_9RHOB|nr:peptidase M48 [Actibacterium pelagium]
MAAGRAFFARVLLLALLALTFAAPAKAQTLIRDAEIEYSLRQLMRPIAAAAGLNANSLRVVIVKDNSLNAFVADNESIFLHSGLILKLDSAAEMQAVLSHEIAHIANGHIARRQVNAKTAGNAAKIGTLLGMALAASGNGAAGSGIAAGSASSSQRVFFGHTRAEESAADQSGARYMARAGVSPQAMADVLDIFRGQEALIGGRQDPYVRTHPLSAERLRRVKGYAAAYPVDGADTSTADYWFARARGKLGAFLQNPSFTLRKVGKKDQSDVALMRRAVAYHRKPDAKNALREINALMAKRPKDPFAHELKGQILLESRQFGAAVNAYANAVNLSPNHPLILGGYGRALLALKTADGNKRALSALQKARSRDFLNPGLLRDLAVAYARSGQNGQASLATAERYAITGRLKDAAVHAKRASDLLPNGSPGWRRAQDILAAAKTAGTRR